MFKVVRWDDEDVINYDPLCMFDDVITVSLLVCDDMILDEGHL
jgi:hypothetical protein